MRPRQPAAAPAIAAARSCASPSCLPPFQRPCSHALYPCHSSCSCLQTLAPSPPACSLILCFREDPTFPPHLTEQLSLEQPAGRLPPSCERRAPRPFSPRLSCPHLFPSRFLLKGAAPPQSYYCATHILSAALSPDPTRTARQSGGWPLRAAPSGHAFHAPPLPTHHPAILFSSCQHCRYELIR